MAERHSVFLEENYSHSNSYLKPIAPFIGAALLYFHRSLKVGRDRHFLTPTVQPGRSAASPGHTGKAGTPADEMGIHRKGQLR